VLPFQDADGRLHVKTYTVCGLVDYLAPEAVLLTGHGFPVDVWAFGCLLYEMLVGKVRLYLCYLAPI